MIITTNMRSMVVRAMWVHEIKHDGCPADGAPGWLPHPLLYSQRSRLGRPLPPVSVLAARRLKATSFVMEVLPRMPNSSRTVPAVFQYLVELLNCDGLFSQKTNTSKGNVRGWKSSSF